jgi:hypothetical protein
MKRSLTVIKLTILTGIVLGLALILTMLFSPPKAHAAGAYSYQYVGQSGYVTIPKAGKQASLTIRNTGTATWCKACATPTRLGTSHPNDRGSGFIGGNRVDMDQAIVLPGQDATFTFTINRVPSYPGTLREYFTPVVDGVTWMADIGIYWDWTTPAPIGVIMFSWYDNAARWTTSPEHAIDTPQIGQYRSSDPAVQRQQLNQIRDAGADIVILDFWDHDPYPSDNTAAISIAIAHLIQAEYPTLKFTFLIEPGAYVPIPQTTYERLWTEFGDSPQWYRYRDGNKALFTYGGVDGQANVHNFITLEYDNREPDPMFQDLYWILQPARMKNRKMTIFPSFSNCHYANPCLSYDPTLTGQVFNDQFGAAMARRGSLDVLVWYGWNEYGERAQIEPSYHAGSNRGPTYLYDLWKQSIDQWNNQ